MPDVKSILIYVLLAACVALGVASCASTTMLKSTRSALATTKATLKTTNDRIREQKREAAGELRAANASVLAQQKRLDAAYQSQEKTDATNGKTIDGLRSDLRRVRAAARGLLDAADSARRGDGGEAQQGEAAAGAHGGAGDRAQADRVLPATADEEGDDDAYEADRVNAAYASCRADAFSVRVISTPP